MTRASWVALAMLTAVVTLAVAPALAGGWIYDDVRMSTSPLMDGLDDAAAVFGRDSSDYFSVDAEGEPDMGMVTYRPLPMLSLILVHALVGSPWAHHLLSLVLHLGCVGLLLLILLPDGDAPVHPLLALPVAWFALHPGILEAYAWINGRSDVLAGSMLCLLAWALLRGHGSRAPWLLIAGLSTWGGVLSKVTFIPAAFAVAAAALLRRGRSAWPAAGAALAGLVVAWLQRGWVMASHGRSSVAELFDGPTWLASVFRGAMLSLDTLLFPGGQVMRNLAWELTRPIGIGAWIALAVGIGAAGLAVHHRRWDSLALMLGAAATVAPTFLVASAFWLGLDRYLYLPALLLCLAAAPALHRLATRPEASGRALSLAIAALVLSFGVLSFRASGAYRDQDTWISTMVLQRPDDPTGYLLAASYSLVRDDRPTALSALSTAPPRPWPSALAREAARLERELGLWAQAARTVEDSARRSPTDPLLRFDLLTLRGAQRRFDEGYALAESLLESGAMCKPTRQALQSWVDSGQLSSADEGRFAALLERRPCR